MTAASALSATTSSTPSGTTLTASSQIAAGQNPFAALLAAIGMVMPALPQQAVVATDGQSEAKTTFGRPFNFDPVSLVTVDGQPVTDTVDGDSQSSLFPAELMAALTPGTPAPVATPPAVTAGDELAMTGAVLPAPPPTSQQAQQQSQPITAPAKQNETPPLLTATGLAIPDMAAVVETVADVPAAAAPTTNTRVASVPTMVADPTTPPAVITVAVTAPAPKEKPVTLTASNTAPANNSESPQKWFEGDNAAHWQFNADSNASPRSATPPHTPLSRATVVVAQAGNGNAAEHSALFSKGQTDPGDFVAGLASTTPGLIADGDNLLLTSGSNILLPSSGVQVATLTHTPSASVMHPATGVVAANIQAAASGMDKAKSFSLTLTPAELGRVQVDMKLDSAKKMKVTLTVEKETTFHLLQRDSTVLQSILDKTSDSADITFELASDQHNFDGTNDQRSAFQESSHAGRPAHDIRLDAVSQHTDVGAQENVAVPGRVNKLV